MAFSALRSYTMEVGLSLLTPAGYPLRGTPLEPGIELEAEGPAGGGHT
jgi:hypothetical protein